MRKIVVEIKSEPIIYEFTAGLSTIPHVHNSIELIYVESGKSEAFSDNRSSEITDGDIFFAFPNQVHYYEGTVLGKYHLLIFSPNILFGIKSVVAENTPEANVLYFDKNSSATELFKKINECDGEYKQTKQASLINQLMCQILEHTPVKPKTKTDNTTIQNLLKFCEDNFTEDIKLEDISAELHLNKYYISRLLNRQVGRSFNDYINALRINKACELLKETDKKISEISEEVGFGSIRTFNRTFSSVIGLTPVKYRKQFS